MQEIWKDIDGFEGLYQVSNLGQVKRILFINNITIKQTNKILTSKKDNLGYVQVTLCKNNTRNYRRMHRLVAMAFLPNPHNLPCVNHIDGNKKNNRVDNLEWCTHSYNTRHALSNGLINNDKIQKARKINIQKALAISHSKNIGERARSAKLTEKNVLEIRKLRFEKKMSTNELSKLYNVHKCTISNIINRKTWKHI